MKLYVVMVTLNCLIYTQRTLGSFKTNLSHNFIIVDNASTDRTNILLDNLSKFLNQIHIRNKTRVSLSTAWNQGLKKALEDSEFKYAYVINNDIEFEPFCVDRLIQFVESHPEYVLVSGLNTRDFAKQEGKIGDGGIDFGAFLVTKECLDKVGFFDENFVGAYYEDNDYHQRVYRAGLKSCVVCDVGFYHYGSRTIKEGMNPMELKQSQANYERNKAYFKQKWGFLPK
jgi:GT2 family glycosyltransferase